MKKINFIILFILISLNLHAIETTDIEYTDNLVLPNIKLTLYDENKKMVECTWFNKEGVPIGGGTGAFMGRVANITIFVPKKYYGKLKEGYHECW